MSEITFSNGFTYGERETRNTTSGSVHAISFATGVARGPLTIVEESPDRHADAAGRTYVFLRDDAWRTWHGYVTPETLAILRHVAKSVVL